MARVDRADKVAKVLRKQFGADSVQLFRDDDVNKPKEVIPTGLEALDHYVLGIGGLPVGRIVELYSEEGAGKSSMAYTFLGAAQRAGGSAVMVETEHAFDPGRPQVFGAKVEDLLLMQPDHLGDVLKITESLCKYLGSLGGGPSVLVWDSVAATPTKAEFEGGIAGDAGHGADRARELSRAMRILTKQVAQSRACLVCVNQIRENIGVMFGDKYTTAGGRAIKFHASIRLQILGGAKVEAKGEHTGKDVTLMTVKNKLAPPWRKARARLSYENGWDNDWTTLSHAKDKDLVASRARVGKATMKEARSALGWPWVETEGVEV